MLYRFGDKVLWNSKKWRMLVHANDMIMFAGRQYPFSSKSGIDIALNIYNNLTVAAGKPKWSAWSAGYVDSYVPYDADPNAKNEAIGLDSKYIIYNYRLIDLEDVVKEGPNARNYNDVLNSTCYKYPYYSVSDPFGWKTVEMLLANPIIVGAEVPCLHCGDELIQNSETMRCDDCELEFGTEENDIYTTCDCCGQRIYVDDAWCVINGRHEEYVCHHCYTKYCFTCDGCGETFYNEDRNYIDEDGDICYCDVCYKEENE
jgi:hypothetical protein